MPEPVADAADPPTGLAPDSAIVVDGIVTDPAFERQPGRFLDEVDWADNPLGPVAAWSGERRGIVDTVLAMPQPATALFGDEAIIVCNPAFASLADRPPSRLLGRAAGLAWPEFPGFEAGVIGAVSAGERRSLVAQTLDVCENGERQPRQVDILLSPIRDPAGMRLGILVIARAIVRSAGNAAESPGQAEKLQTLGEMASEVAHDFNNFVTAVLGNLDFVATRLAGAGDRDARAYLDGARNAAERATSLAQRLLGFVRDNEPAPAAVDIAAVIEKGAVVMRGMLASDIRLRFACDAGVWPVRCDPDALQAALLNLVSNSGDAMPAGGSLVISAENACFDANAAGTLGLPSAGDYVVLSVADSGVGMSEPVAARALQPFFTTKRQGDGTGLGLAMTRDFATACGGDVSIASVPGVGTTVRVYLPRCVESAGWHEA